MGQSFKEVGNAWKCQAFLHTYQINPLEMERVIMNADALNRLTTEVNRTIVRVWKTQHGTHMLMKAVAENGEYKNPPKYRQSMSNRVTLKPKNIDGVCLLEANAWERLSAKKKDSRFVEIRVSPDDEVVWSD